MKKSLIALAVLASAAGAAQAQSVTLYGLVDVWVGKINAKDGAGNKVANPDPDGPAFNTAVMESGGLNGSRWGLKGEEDLGGGLKGIFKIESGFSADTGTGAGGPNRQSYLGLEGGFGTLTLGNTWTAMDDIIGASNSGFDSALSASQGVLDVPGNYESNPGNTIKYVSPNFGGFSGGFTHSLKEANVNGGITDFSLSYGAGPIAANFAYQVQNQAVEDLKLTHLNGSYDLGVAKLLASFGQLKEGADKATDIQFGADVPLSSALTLSAGYAQSKDNAARGNEKRTGFGVAATYSLSKRTTAYTGLRSSRAKDGNVTVEKANVFAVGLRHTF